MRSGLVCALLAVLATSTPAQWLNYPTPGTPRTRDGKPDLTAKTPRAYNGKPDLSGVWHVEPPPLEERRRLAISTRNAVSVPGMEPDTISKYGLNILTDFKPEDSPLRPEAAEIQARRAREARPSVSCLPTGIPLSTLVSEVHKIVQTPGLIVVMLELDSANRQIYTDGRKHPVDPNPSWLGYSVGKWEGDTLLVDTIGFNDKTQLDLMGHPHSEGMRVLERFHRRDFGHLDMEITIDDPKMYTKPFTIKVTHLLQADSDILEYFCENEKDRAHLGLN